MTTLAANVNRVFELGDYQDYPMIASDIIYQGAAVGDNGSGYARPLVAGDPFLGFSDSKVDNSTGSAGAKSVTTFTRGLIQLAVGSAAIADVGKPVYASDDDTFTLTESTNTAIGRIVRWFSTGVVIVAFDTRKAGLGGMIIELTDGSTGTASDTISAISDTNTKHAIASITKKLNTIIRLLGN